MDATLIAVLCVFAVLAITPSWVGSARKVRYLTICRCVMLPALLGCLLALDAAEGQAQVVLMSVLGFIWAVPAMWCVVGTTRRKRASSLGMKFERSTRATRYPG